MSLTESSLNKCDVFVELPLIRVQRSEDGKYFTTTQANRWRAFYLFSTESRNSEDVSRECSGVLCTFVSLRGQIFASIEKFGSHV